MSDQTPPSGPNDPRHQPPPPPGQPYGSPYGAQSPYGNQPAYGSGYVPGPYAGHYAGWGKRVGATLLDGLIGAVVSIPFYIGYFWLISSLDTSTDAYGNTTADTADISPVAVVLMVVGLVIVFAFYIWNLCIKQGRTGYSLGKGVVGIKLVKEATGEPVGAGLSFVRQIVHILDSLPCYLGWLWPLWDVKHQTFADKIMSTVVIDAPKP